MRGVPEAGRLIVRGAGAMRASRRSLGAILLAACVATAVPGAAAAQSATVAATRFERWHPHTDASTAPAALAPTYRPNHWKEGALVGVGVGLLAAAAVLLTCDADANTDCPGWGRAAIALPLFTVVGAGVGLLVPKRPAGDE